MTNFLEDAEVRSIDDIALEDTIEMVLSESAMQSLSQAAAPTEQPRASLNLVLKEPEAPPVAETKGPAQEVQASAEAKAPAVPKAPDPVRPDRRPPMSTLRFAILLGVVAAASGLATVLTYFATTHTEQPAPIATTIVFSPPAPVIVAPPALPPAPSPPPQEAPAPVRFANPFDRNEVFEFPAGTSRADARDAVEELLYERAQERQPSGRGLVVR
jgi:hypothetical protein